MMTNEQIAERIREQCEAGASTSDVMQLLEDFARFRAPVALPWQPIETAPRIDRHRILALTQSDFEKEPRVRILVWNDGIGKVGYTWPCWMCDVTTVQIIDRHIQGWVPLPAPSGVSAPAAGVPAGCKLVPEWPTDEMLDAARAENDKWPFGAGHMNIYRAMLAAAPAANAPVNEQMLEALETAFAGDLTYLSDNAMIPRQSVVMARLAIRDARAALAHAQSDSAGDASRSKEWLEIGKAMERACNELPDGYDLNIELEKGAGTIRLYLADSDAYEHEWNGDTFGSQIDAAIDAAIAASAATKGEQKNG
jgi:hypothetical protein